MKQLVLIYGVLSYFLGVAGLVVIILACAGTVRWGFLLEPGSSNSQAVLWNLFLVAAWGFIHTGMARQSFKDVLTKLLPEPAERPTYVLIAGLTSIGLIGYWQGVAGQIWLVETSWAVALLWGIFVFGWVFCLSATFAINHFDLFGLRQVYLNFRGLPKPPLNFVKRAMYNYVRHPIQTGVLIGVWATPSMSATQIVLSIGFTAYIFIGLWFEERDLVESIGQDYIDYRQETGKVFPKIRGR